MLSSPIFFIFLPSYHPHKSTSLFSSPEKLDLHFSSLSSYSRFPALPPTANSTPLFFFQATTLIFPFPFFALKKNSHQKALSAYFLQLRFKNEDPHSPQLSQEPTLQIFSSPKKLHPTLFVFSFSPNRLCFLQLSPPLRKTHQFFLWKTLPSPVPLLPISFSVIRSKPIPFQPPPWRDGGVFLVMRPMHVAPKETDPHSKSCWQQSTSKIIKKTYAKMRVYSDKAPTWYQNINLNISFIKWLFEYKFHKVVRSYIFFLINGSFWPKTQWSTTCVLPEKLVV